MYIATESERAVPSVLPGEGWGRRDGAVGLLCDTGKGQGMC
jgi:hypothetical protein